MKSLHFVLLVSLLSVAALSVHTQTSPNADPASESRTASKRGPVFRANKDQVAAAQKMLKTKGIYTGDATGKLDSATRDSIKNFQQNNGLRATGTLNRATLEKMGIALTDKQKEIPASTNSYASAGKTKSSDGKSKRSIFRATKEQIIEAQKLLRTGGMYSGEETGKLDDTTRESLRKYQEAKGLKATGTLNQPTLEKMGIALTDKQKGAE
jgi:peptidoglycan hydrolase-like protein with peptidoglycan-binding domain